jgi:predicted nucleic-acid-binding protein
MIGIDTNILVRYIMQDDIAQARAANRFVDSLSAESPGFVPMVVIVELVWVLGSAYRLDRARLLSAITGILSTKELVAEQPETVWKAVRAFEADGADFADCLIAQTAMVAGCTGVMTFDRKAASRAGMSLLG